eukprot:TRINITY_DN67004_c3_g1_i1.p1 TRINITY_DN67004_c3_g1~~TRINITY_DN67004_c3_g1_i1.p1  ORF type:complete len:158 (-),score=19.12 TRINITY_DN67004_c3_g1_i1:106-579(-)
MEQGTQDPLIFGLSAGTVRQQQRKNKLAADEAQVQREAENRRWCQCVLQQIQAEIEENLSTVTDKQWRSEQPPTGTICFWCDNIDYKYDIPIEGTSCFNNSDRPPVHTIAETLKAAGYTCEYESYTGGSKSDFPIPTVTVMPSPGCGAENDGIHVSW